MGHIIPLRIMPFLNNSFWSLTAMPENQGRYQQEVVTYCNIWNTKKKSLSNLFPMFLCSGSINYFQITFSFFGKFHTFTELELSFSQQPEMFACSGSLPFLVVLFTVDYFPQIKERSLLTLKLLSASVTLSSSCKNSQKMNYQVQQNPWKSFITMVDLMQDIFKL